jgi:hypothetical protein
METLNKQTFTDKIFDLNGTGSYKGLLPAMILIHNSGKFFDQTTNIVLSLSVKHTGRITFYNIDADVETDLVNMLGIKALPTMLLIPINDNGVILVGTLKDEVTAEKGILATLRVNPLIITK